LWTATLFHSSLSLGAPPPPRGRCGGAPSWPDRRFPTSNPDGPPPASQTPRFFSSLPGVRLFPCSISRRFHLTFWWADSPHRQASPLFLSWALQARRCPQSGPPFGCPPCPRTSASRGPLSPADPVSSFHPGTGGVPPQLCAQVTGPFSLVAAYALVLNVRHQRLLFSGWLFSASNLG